jgi:hypothetical protein
MNFYTRVIGAGFAGAILLLTGCAGGGMPAVPTATGQTATAYVVIKIPSSTSRSAASSSNRRPAYVSPATQSITVQVDGGSPTVQNLTSKAPQCASAGANVPLNCTVPVSASPGVHALTFITYDQPNAAGSHLSANSISVTFVAGKNPVIPVILAGVPASLQLVPRLPSNAFSGNAATGVAFSGAAQAVLITALDADGNYIVGPGEPSFAVSVSGASTGSRIAVTAAGSRNPNEFMLTSAGIGTAKLTIVATPTATLAGSPLRLNVSLTATALTTTIAGNPGVSRFADGTGTAANFYAPDGLASDSGTGDLYVTDTVNCAIRKVTLGNGAANSGVVTTIAGAPGRCGFADGTGAHANFNLPSGITYDSTTRDLYVTDTSNCSIRQVTPTGVVSTLAGAAGSCGFADGTGSSAHFFAPAGIVVDPADGNLYVTDTDSCAIRKVTTAGVVTTVAGSTSCGFVNGTGARAHFNRPAGIAYDSAGGSLYVSDSNNCAIRKVTTAGAVTTIAGAGPTSCGYADGIGPAASFYGTTGIAYNSITGNLYVADTFTCTIRQVTTAGVVTTIAGSSQGCGFADGTGSSSFFSEPAGIANDSLGNLYVTDTGNQTVRQVQP